MKAVDFEFVAGARRLASLARRFAPEDAWLFERLVAEADHLRPAVRAASILARVTVPADLVAIEGSLPDDLERSFAKALVVFSCGGSVAHSEQWAREAYSLAKEAAKQFAGRGRVALSSQVCSAAAQLVERLGLTRESDRLNILARDMERRIARPRVRVQMFLAKVIADYGYSPMKVFLVAAAIVVVAAVVLQVRLSQGWDHSLALAVGDYVTLGGAPEFAPLATGPRLWLALEAFVAIVLNGFFITLLAKKLFKS